MITKFIKYKKFENIKINKERNVLFIDEHGKNIVYDYNNYRIAVDDINSARYITLWYYTNKNIWKKIGYLSAYVSKINNKDKKGKYLSINSIEIDIKHRNKGLGNKMFKYLIDFAGDDIKGLYSYLPNRINKKQIPKIYNRLNAETDGDYQFINFI